MCQLLCVLGVIQKRMKIERKCQEWLRSFMSVKSEMKWCRVLYTSDGRERERELGERV